MRDEYGSLVGGFWRKLICSDPYIAKALALSTGCSAVKEMRLTNVVLETDSKIVFKALTDTSKIADWSFNPILKEIKLFKSHFQKIKLSLVRRAANKSVDLIAHWYRQGMVLVDWIQTPPYSLSVLSMADLQNNYFVESFADVN